MPAAVLSVMSGLLLVMIAGTFAGDSVAGDAIVGNLRYLLMRPVPRATARCEGDVAGMLDLGGDVPCRAGRARRRSHRLRREGAILVPFFRRRRRRISI